MDRMSNNRRKIVHGCVHFSARRSQCHSKTDLNYANMHKKKKKGNRRKAPIKNPHRK